MATRIAWLLNLDADRELQDPNGYRAVSASGHGSASSSAERTAELRARIADLIAPDDLVLDADADAPRAATTSSLADFSVQAFCPTPSALARITALGLHAPPAPAFAILRAANDRSFCAALGHGLPGACFVRDMPALLACLQQPSPTGRHVIKRAFSFAGREQRRVEHGLLDASTQGFCAHSFARGEGVQVEAWVERLADFSQHGYLTQRGELLSAAPREQRCDAMGRFLGMSAHAAQLAAHEAALLARELAKTGAALTDAGYFGPFGIDAFRYQEISGGIAFNPRCEINARFTMGYPRALLLNALTA